jgi:hypothetical protein
MNELCDVFFMNGQTLTSFYGLADERDNESEARARLLVFFLSVFGVRQLTSIEMDLISL